MNTAPQNIETILERQSSSGDEDRLFAAFEMIFAGSDQELLNAGDSLWIKPFDRSAGHPIMPMPDRG